MAQYTCSSCGYGSASWYGKCPQCSEWNTFEKIETPTTRGKKGIAGKKIEFIPLSKLETLSSKRKPAGIFEFDRVLGGGFVHGETILIAGEPGVGKSTLLLSLISNFNTVYISGEESGHQVKQRAERLNVKSDQIRFSNEISVESIVTSLAGDTSSELVIIDSIQTVYSSGIPSPMGSATQIRESASQLVDLAKQHNKILIIVGHVTKEGDIAGPKTLEHLVDCVLYLEGEKQSQYRVLRSHKNRFGPTDEVGLFEMVEGGLQAVDDPTVFLDQEHNYAPGSSSIAVIEGSRTLFFEVQSLVVKTSLSIPRRVVSGVDYNRLQLLLAVMRKYMNVRFDEYDVYVNVVGGVSAKSTSADLGIVMSILSSLSDKPLPKKSVSIGEIGLLGEIRRVNGQNKAINEARRLKFSHIYSSENIKKVHLIKKLLLTA